MNQHHVRLAACAEMLFRDLPLLTRVHRIAELGFEVEVWGWQDKDLRALSLSGATFSSMTGYLEGDLLTEQGSTELLRTAELSLRAADVLDSPRLNLHGTGLDSDGQAIRKLGHGEVLTQANWDHARATLTKVAELGAKAGRVFTLENLNTAVDHPGTPFAKASETLELVSSIDHPNLRLNLDLYHAQIGEGNLIELVLKALPFVGEIQIADVPGRMEPGTGEIRYPAIATVLKESGYDGVVALEAWASGDSTVALEAFRAAFTI